MLKSAQHKIDEGGERQSEENAYQWQREVGTYHWVLRDY